MRPVMRLLCGRVNVRKSSFSTLLQQWLRIPALHRMGDGERRGAEPHTCQMICHYRGVSSQLSPPNHPSYPTCQPPFTPQTLLQPSKNTSCIPQASPVSLAALLPHLPLLPLLHPERKCTPVRDPAHWAHCMDVQCVCLPHVHLHNSRASIYVYLRAEMFVLIPKANRWGRLLPVKNMWIGAGCSPETNPCRHAKHSELSQVYYICQQQSFITMGHRSHSSIEHSFLLDVWMCERKPQLLSYPLSTRLSQVVLPLCEVVRISVTSYPREPTNHLAIR